MIVLTAIFVMAKLMNVIAWSWWLVLLPVWIYLISIAIAFAVAAIIVIVTEVLEKHDNNHLL